MTDIKSINGMAIADLKSASGLVKADMATVMGLDVPSAAATLDSPLYTAINSKGQLVFGFDELAEGYTGDTVRLKKEDDSEADFGLDANGIFDYAAADTWGGDDDLRLVHFKDQLEGAKTLGVSGTIYAKESGSWHRLGTDWTESDAQLVRSSTKGAAAVNITGGVYLVLTSTGVNVSTADAEFHMLLSHNNRKKKSNDSSDPLSGTTAKEMYLNYGKYDYKDIMLAAFCHDVGLYLQNGFGDVSQGTSGRIKEHSQSVISVVMDSTNLHSYVNGRRIFNHTVSGTRSDLDNANIRIGDNPLWVEGTPPHAMDGNFLFSGIVITTGLTDAERFQVTSRFTQVGQQHRIKTVAQIEAMFDEIIYFKDADSGNNQVVGKNNKLILDFNTGTIDAKDPTWTYDYAHPYWGVKGVRNGGTSNQSEVFKAQNNYFAGRTTCSALVVGNLEGYGFHSWFGQGTGGYADSDAGTQGACLNHSLSMGHDHDGYVSLYTNGASSRGDCGTFWERRQEYNYPSYDGANQPMGKYGFALAHTVMLYGETVTYNGTPETWERVDWRTKAYTDQPTAENLGSTLAQIHLHIATWKAHASYDRDEAGRNAYGALSENWSYVGGSQLPIGHADGSIASSVDKVADTAFGSTCDSDDDAQIMSSFRVAHQACSRIMFGFFPDGKVLSLQEIEEIQCNLYKLLV